MKRGLAIPLAKDEQIAFALLNGETLKGKRIFIVAATNNVIEPLEGKYPDVRDFRDRVEIIIPTHYWRRWSRRLQRVGFTREDARILGIGTFGSDAEGSFLGVQQFLTFDKPLMTLFEIANEQIRAKLDELKRDLKPPYDGARLPDVKLLGDEEE